MNPADLQRRLDAAALPPEPATDADWARNVELVRARTRRRRVERAVVAGLAAAAAVAVAVTWHPPVDSARVVPAGPPRSSARLVDPESLRDDARRCAESSGNAVPVQPVWGGRGDDVEAVLYRTAAGALRFCSVFGGGTSTDGPVSPSGPRAGDGAPDQPPRDTVSSALSAAEGESTVSAFGFVPTSVAQVLVLLPDGRDVRAELDGGKWWVTATVADDADLREVGWRALDAQGGVVEESAGP